MVKMALKFMNQLFSAPPDRLLDSALELSAHCPHVPTYSLLCKVKANSLRREESADGDDILASAYLVESLGQSMRSKALTVNGYAVRHPDLSEEIKENKQKSLNILSRLSSLPDQATLKEMIQKLPKNLVVIQIMEMYDIPQTQKLLGGRLLESPTPDLLITRFSAQEPPVTFETSPESAASGTGELGLLPLFETTIKEHQSMHAGSCRIDRSKYWKLRKEHDNNMKEVVTVLEEKWLGKNKCLLWNKYREGSNNSLAEELLSFVVKRLGQLKLSQKQNIFLRLLCNAAQNYSKSELQTALSSCINLPIDDPRIVTVVSRMHELKFGHLGTAQRHPVVLVLDRKLQLLPWESLNCLKGQPVSRVPSLHFLCHFLARYQDKLTMSCSLSLKVQTGGYIVNPGSDLQGNEERMKPFFKALWGSNGYVGSVTAEQFLGLLKKNELVVYCGHGSGAQFLGGEAIAQQDLNVLPLLMGCSSGALHIVGRRTDPLGHVFYYFIAGSPAVMGNLWDVTDLDTDNFTTRFLETWLGKRKEGVVLNKNLPSPPTSTEANMLVAVSQARVVSKSILNSMAPIVYGLPVFSVQNDNGGS